MTEQNLVVLAYGNGGETDVWLEALRRHLPADLPLQPLSRPVDPARVRYVVAWRHQPGSLAPFTTARAIFSLGAGVDHLISDPALPEGVPIVRVVDPDLADRMGEWVVLNVLMHHRQVRLYDWQQGEKLWTEDLFQPAARDVRVGIMGLGVLGSDAARKLRMLGFDVAGWSRTPKALPGLDMAHGTDGLPAMLGRCDILVCLIPLTPETRGLVNAERLSALKPGAALINFARGPIVVTDDLIAALDRGHLAHAVLDVFDAEPLAADSPLWSHPGVTVLPHISGPTDLDSAAATVAANLEAYRRTGAPPRGVDAARGY